MQEDNYQGGLTERSPNSARDLLKTGDKVATAAKADIVSRIAQLEAVQDSEDISS